MIFARAFLHTHHHVAVHLQKPAIRVPGEARIVGLFSDDFDDFVIHPKVENCVHHAWHGIARPRTDRDQKGALFVAKLFAD